MVGQTEIPLAFKDYLQQRSEIVAAYLFGSVAAGKAHKFSDVDVALLLADGVAPKQAYDFRLEVMGEAEAAFGRRADVAVLNTSPLVFCYLTLKHGRLIFDRGLPQRPEFEARVYVAYFDLKPYLEDYDAAMFKRIKERGLGYGYSKTASAAAKTE